MLDKFKSKNLFIANKMKNEGIHKLLQNVSKLLYKLYPIIIKLFQIFNNYKNSILCYSFY